MKWYYVFLIVLAILVIIAVFFGEDVKVDENLDEEVMEMMYPEQKRRRRKVKSENVTEEDEKEEKELTRRLFEIHLRKKNATKKLEEQSASNDRESKLDKVEEASKTVGTSVVGSISTSQPPTRSRSPDRTESLSRSTSPSKAELRRLMKNTDLSSVLSFNSIFPLANVPTSLTSQNLSQISLLTQSSQSGQVSPILQPNPVQDGGISPTSQTVICLNRPTSPVQNGDISPTSQTVICLNRPMSPPPAVQEQQIIQASYNKGRKKIVKQGAINLSLMSDSGNRGLIREPKCGEIIQRLFGREFLQGQRPDFLKNPESGRNLELDWWCPELKLALEHNGEQHYTFPNGFHSTKPKEYLDYHKNNPQYHQILKQLYETDISAFKSKMKQDDPKDEIGLRKFAQQLRRDEFKKRICEEQGIHLISVPYHIPYDCLEQFIIDSIPDELKSFMLPYD